MVAEIPGDPMSPDPKSIRDHLLRPLHERRVDLDLVLSEHSLLVPLLPQLFQPYLQLSKYFLLGGSGCNAYVLNSEVLARCIFVLLLVEINEQEQESG